MPLPNLETLQAGPETLLAWLENSLLSSSFLHSTMVPNARHWLRLEALPHLVAVNANGQTVDAYIASWMVAGVHSGAWMGFSRISSGSAPVVTFYESFDDAPVEVYEDFGFAFTF